MSSNSFGDNEWVSIGPEGGYVQAFAINPQSPDTLYAGTTSGIFKSTNGGTNWTPMGPTSTYVQALAINPQAPETLYAGTTNGIFKSTNGETNWAAINTGLTNTNVNVLAINPPIPETLYAGTLGGGVFKIQQTEPIVSVPTTTAWGTMLLIMFLALMALYFLNKIRNSHSQL